jgi:hypothetical protein
MSLALLLVLFVAVSIYWFLTQIRPERQRFSMVRRGLGEGLLVGLNERRHARGLPVLELDEELCAVAENKAVHQVMTGRSEEGWEYPAGYRRMFGRSLLLEALVAGQPETMTERLARQRDLLDGEWVRCGVGCAGDAAGQVVVAVILCREAWEPVAEVARGRAWVEV